MTFGFSLSAIMWVSNLCYFLFYYYLMLLSPRGVYTDFASNSRTSLHPGHLTVAF
jgi:hypothetical protein